MLGALFFRLGISMKVHVSLISVFPEVHESFLNTSLVKRAQDAGILSVSTYKFSSFVPVTERIDVPACGPGAGMVIKAEVVATAIDAAIAEHGDGTVIFFSPQGKQLTQPLLREMYEHIRDDSDLNIDAQETDAEHIILVCGRYEGVDHRTEQQYADYILSIGDYVLMGGDLPAQVFLESYLRLVPGVIGRSASVEQDSFSNHMFDYPAYGKPIEWRGMNVPDVLLSGNHAKIDEWRMQHALSETVKKRFDWVRRHDISFRDAKDVARHIPPHAVVLMHDEVVASKEGNVGTSSVTTIDMHDIARSAATYGLKNYYLVTSLRDQQKIVEQFLEFWHSYKGKQYNNDRFEAMRRIVLKPSLDLVAAHMREQYGADPLIVTTSARIGQFDAPYISYHDQKEVWRHERPVLLVLGTAHGLSNEVMVKSDYILRPLRGFTNYNHLSVRSAAAIIFDRWLGIQEEVHGHRS